jgi:hypothetical protein
MIWNGISVEVGAPYLHSRVWHTDAARLLNRTPHELATELVDTMLSSGAVIHPQRSTPRIRGTHTGRGESLRVPFTPEHGRKRPRQTRTSPGHDDNPAATNGQVGQAACATPVQIMSRTSRFLHPCDSAQH